jgi:hypothetical protein
LIISWRYVSLAMVSGAFKFVTMRNYNKRSQCKIKVKTWYRHVNMEPVDCCFRELALLKYNTTCVGLVQSELHHHHHHLLIY